MEKFSNLPTPVKWVLGVAGAGGLIAMGSVLASGRWIFLVVLLVLLLGPLGGYLLWNVWKRKKQNARLGGQLEQHSSASPRGISDPGQRARLDDLRKKFETGVKEYRSRGKDLYTLPWYAIVGEPGSGKTEAVRHSNVGFPPGMQDEFQGVGGTINMNWWFTNHAVLLDTAGRLMFEEVKPGETSEWKEFLNLLKKNRPTCPINGLFLVIPSDSLIKDSADDIQKKAGKIAQQLDVIQRTLDVRFPVFVIVTKCDKINGFREFFDGLTDPQLQHQMMGWSNPDSLDTPFRAELVDQHLDKVVQRLRKRRLGLLRDPVAENPSSRRTDEVDSLYSLPHSLSLLAPRLRRYLETIFIAGEWSAKPLFLRGIYFSSSMREGSALDEELADAIGVPVDELPEGKVWERERAYFLRDLFIEKVFRERGLVTRAGNTSQMLRRQQIILFGCIFLALAVFVSIAWIGTKSLKGQVEQQSKYWAAATNWWENKTWKQSIIPRRPDGIYAGYATNQVEVDGRKIPMGEFFLELQRLATNELKNNWAVPGLADQYNKNSKRAQRIVFEGGVIKPLVEATRQKMVRSQAGEAGSQKGQAEALAALIRLEVDILGRAKGTNQGETDSESARNFLASLSSYAAAQDTVDPNLVSTMVWTYTTNQEARGSWPPAWFSGTTNQTNNSLANNPALQAGLDVFVRNATNGIRDQIDSWGQIAELRGALRKFEEQENKLFRAAQSADAAAAREQFTALDQANRALEEQRKKVAGSSLFQGGVLLNGAYQKFWNAVTASSAGALSSVETVNQKGLMENPRLPLFADIQKQLAGVRIALSNRIAQLVSAGEQEELKKLDDLYLASPGCAERWSLYQQAMKIADKKLFQPGNLVGAGGVQWDRFLEQEISPLTNAPASYAGNLKPQLVTTYSFLLGVSGKVQHEAFLAMYLQEANKKLNDLKRFPLVTSPSATLSLDELKEADKQLKYVSEDLKSPALQSFSARPPPGFAGFVTNVANLSRVSRAILGDFNSPGKCVVSLAKADDAFRSVDEWRGTWRGIKLGAGNPEKIDSLIADLELGTVTTDEQKLAIQIIRNPSEPNLLPPPALYETGKWGVFWLLLLPQYNAKTSDRMTWTVRWPIKPVDGTGDIRLVLKFERALPDLANWPHE